MFTFSNQLKWIISVERRYLQNLKAFGCYNLRFYGR